MLVDAIKKYEECIEEKDPGRLELFNPGLTDDEIQSIISTLGIDLPDELVELYMWRNGLEGYTYLEDFFNGYTFVPLQVAAQTYQQCLEVTEKVTGNKHRYWPVSDTIKYGALPVFQTDKHYLGITGTKTKESKTPIYSCSCWPDGEYPIFTSLEAVFLTLFSCYEKGIYPIPEDEDPYDYFEHIDSVRIAVDQNSYQESNY